MIIINFINNNINHAYTPQAIRHDAYGYVRQIIYWISTLSPIVTHQIIWNMKTNMYLDEDAQQIVSLKI